MGKIETLQSKAYKKLSPTTRGSIPPFVTMNAEHDIAKEIQRSFRSSRYLTIRDGSLQTTTTMRKQLIARLNNSDFNNFFEIFKNTLMEQIDDYIKKNNIPLNNVNRVSKEILINNMNRDLLIFFYNKLLRTKGILEDPDLFSSIHGRGINIEKTKNKTKTKAKKTKAKKTKAKKQN